MTSERATIKVLLNLSSMRYKAGDDLREAIAFESGLPACGDVTKLLKIVFDQLTRETPTTRWAEQYQLEGNRKMTFGDVIVVGTQAYTLNGGGWAAIDINHQQLVDMGHPRYGR